MTTGIPGTGIGGVFYLLSALFMPLFAIVQVLRGQGKQEQCWLIIRQLAMALCIIAGMWLLGVVLGLLIQPGQAGDIAGVMNGQFAVQVERVTQLNVFHIAPLLMS